MCSFVREERLNVIVASSNFALRRWAPGHGSRLTEARFKESTLSSPHRFNVFPHRMQLAVRLENFLTNCELPLHPSELRRAAFDFATDL